MILLTATTPIMLACEPVDFRRGIDGFAALCRQQLATDPRCGTVFVFINRNKTMIRALCYEDNGFWLMSKRLSKGRFVGWPAASQKNCTVAARQLRILLSGTATSGWQTGAL